MVAFYHQNQLLIGQIEAENQGLFTLKTLSGDNFELRQGRFALYAETSEDLASFHNKLQSLLDELAENGLELPDKEELSLEQVAAKLHKTTGTERFALYIHLKNHPELYLHRKDRFRSLTNEERQNYRLACAAKNARAEYLKEICEVANGGKLKQESQLQLYNELSELMLEHRHKDLQQQIAKAFPQLDGSGVLQQFRLACGELDANCDPAIAESGIPIGFAGLCIEEELLPVVKSEPVCEAFCIDSEDTKDFDDALSLKQEGDNWLLGIHVSAVGAALQPQGLLYAEARRRISSLYAANLVVPMFPPSHSEQGLSLVSGTVKPVLSLYVKLDKHHQIIDKRLCMDNVLITANHSYRETDKQLDREPFFTLHKISLALAARRDSQTENRRERFYRYLKLIEGRLEVCTIDNASPARMLVEELMILYNSTLAEFALQNQIPVLFRNVQQWGDPKDPYPATQAYLSTQASFHPGIGANAYLHASSPVRRFVDLLNQTNILAYLAGVTPPYPSDSLEAEIERIEKRLHLLKETGQQSDRYWWLKYLEQNWLHTPLDGYVLTIQKGRMRIELPDWGIQVWVAAPHYPQEELLKLVFTGVDWKDWLLKAEIL